MELKRRAIFGAIVIIIASIVLYRWRDEWLKFDSPSSDSSTFVRCRPRVLRSPIPSRRLESFDLHDSLAGTLSVSSHPLLIRGNLPRSYGWVVHGWSGEYFTRASEHGGGTLLPKTFTIKRSETPIVKFANMRADRPFVRMKSEETGNSQTGGSPPTDTTNSNWPQMEPFVVPFTSHNVTVRKFFEEIEASSTSSYPYFADGISVLGGLSRDVYPLTPLCPSSDLNQCDMSLWIGRAGVTAYPHYDSSHNLFVQVRGSKRFILAPPEAARCGLGLFPSLHPFYRQAQRDLMMDDPFNDDDTMPFIPKSSIPPGEDCCTLELYDSILEEGDSLYLPSHWFHRVTSLTTPTFSINSWWIDRSFKRHAQVLKQPLPFQQEWTRSKMMLATKMYVRQMYHTMEERIRKQHTKKKTKKANQNTPIQMFDMDRPFLAAELLVTRLRPLFNVSIDPRYDCDTRIGSTDTSVEDEDDDSVASAMNTCSNLTPSSILSLLPTSIRTTLEPSMHNNRTHLLTLLESHFSIYIDRALKFYEDPLVDDGEIERLHLHNVVEEILWYGLKGVREDVYPFVACCIVGMD